MGGRQKKLLQWGFPNICGHLLLSDPIGEKEITQNSSACPEPPTLALRPQEKVQETLWFGLVALYDDPLGFSNP